MREYKNILIAIGYFLKFNPEVGVYLDNGSLQLIGEAAIRKHRGLVYADIKTEIDIEDYFPVANCMSKNIDSLLLQKSSDEPRIKRIKEQLL